MTSEFDDDDLTPEAARTVLSSLSADRGLIAERLVTPWWYHPALAVTVAAILFGTVLPPPLGIILVVLAPIAIVLLAVGYARRYKVWTSGPAGPKSRSWLVVLTALLIVGFLAALAIRFTEQSWLWVLIPTVVVGVGIVVVGPTYDRALREDVRTGQEPRR